MKSIRIFLIISIWINGVLTIPAENLPNSKKKKKEPVSLSLFIPGLNQMKSRQYFKGMILLGAFGACIAGTIINNSKGNNWYDKYKNSSSVEEILIFRNKTEKSLQRRNLYMVGLLSVFLIHLLDLKFFKKKKGGLKGEAGKNSFNIGFYYYY